MPPGYAADLTEEAKSIQQLARQREDAATHGNDRLAKPGGQRGIFGIDFGTANSCIARIDDAGEATVIQSTLGEAKMPSAVYFESPRHAIVGRAARNAALIAPDRVAQLVKRDMGQSVRSTRSSARSTLRR